MGSVRGDVKAGQSSWSREHAAPSPAPSGVSFSSLFSHAMVLPTFRTKPTCLTLPTSTLLPRLSSGQPEKAFHGSHHIHLESPECVSHFRIRETLMHAEGGVGTQMRRSKARKGSLWSGKSTVFQACTDSEVAKRIGEGSSGFCNGKGT